MTKPAADNTPATLLPPPTEFDDKQRAALVKFFKTHPDVGYKTALRQIGIRATQAQAKALVLADEELVHARFQGMGLDEKTLFAGVGEIASDRDHKDRLAALKFALNIIHRYREQTGVEHTGPAGGPLEVSNPDVAAAIERFTALADAAVRAAARPATIRAALEAD